MEQQVNWKIDMLDFADIISTTNLSNVALDALRDVKKQYQRNQIYGMQKQKTCLHMHDCFQLTTQA